MELHIGCRKILEYLHEEVKKYGLDSTVLTREEVNALFGLSEEYEDQTYVFLDFLDQEGYIQLHRPLGSHYERMHLTSKGLKLVSNDSEFNREFRAVSPVSLAVSGNGNNFIGVGSSGNISISNSFNQTLESLQQDQSFTPEQKQILTDLIQKVVSDIQQTREVQPSTQTMISSSLAGMSGNLLSSGVTYLINAVSESLKALV